MRQFLAIALLSLYVFTSTECNELLKLPQLVSHFKEHQEEQKGITLWQFLCDHYAKGDIFDADRHKDMKLPYKSLDANHVLAYNIIPAIISIEIIKPVCSQTLKTPIDYYSNAFCSNNFSFIWQPPKIA